MSEIPSWAFVGASVVCIQKPELGKNSNACGVANLNIPQKGCFYTVSFIAFPDDDPRVGIELSELLNVRPDLWDRLLFPLVCFRPVIFKSEQVSQDVAKFTHLLASKDAKIGEPA